MPSILIMPEPLQIAHLPPMYCSCAAQVKCLSGSHATAQNTAFCVDFFQDGTRTAAVTRRLKEHRHRLVKALCLQNMLEKPDRTPLQQILMQFHRISGLLVGAARVCFLPCRTLHADGYPDADS